MLLPDGFTGRTCDTDTGLVHAVRPFVDAEVCAPDVGLYTACKVDVFMLTDYRDARPVTCLRCLPLRSGLRKPEEL